MNILITGACGFLGSHLTEYLRIDPNNNIIALDNLSGGFYENILVDRKLPHNVDFVEGDIRDDRVVKRLFNNYQFDYVFHLAAYAAEGLSPFIRKYNYETNLVGSVNLINASINHKIKCFVFTSSMGVYGATTEMTEETECHPIDPYGISKLAVEMDLKSAHETHGLNYVIFRPHNIYGEKQNIHDIYRNVVGIFMRQKREGKKATVFNDGNQTRLFSYVKDIIPTIVESATNERFYNSVFNIGGEVPYTINELVTALGMEPEYVGERYEVKNTNPSHDKIRKLLPSYKTTPLGEGLNNMWSWAKTIDLKKQKRFTNLEITERLPNKWI